MQETLDLLMSEIPAFIYIFVFLFGLCVGSFLNVCIYRIPKKESIVVVPSHCTTCGKKLHWYELIPLFSWLALRGKCHGCKSKISAQYPIIETTNAVLWLLVLIFRGLSADMLIVQCLLSALLVIAIIDARTMEIPNGLVLFIGVLAVIRTLLTVFVYDADKSVSLDLVLGFAIMGTVFLLILLISGGRAMGGGDVKLMYVIGLFLGLKLTILGLALGCIIGSVIHLTLMALKKAGRQLAFGPYLSTGFAIAAIWGEPILKWYLGILGI